LIEALASFFNQYFNPHVPVLPAHIAVAPGAAASLDALLYNICDPGEGVLVPGPYWSMRSIPLHYV
jgi:aspartate/methionine/tyrosine aminotransferase